ncbi:MAG: ClC family H(+)/Cl(-) exchange transporter [Proteobacteria bacterium]|nr:ClC family H(+)/Cl(-) exchange transporter [Pseudomonadota bacterium]
MSLIVGVATGLIAALFRLGLEQADTLRARLLDWAHSPAALDDWALGYGPLAQWAVGQPWIGFVVVIGVCAIATATAAWMVRQLAPQASGSGIPHVEAVIHGDAPPGPYALVPVKFIGGILAIGSGLALGREGPSVQMGAGIATFISRLGQRGFPDSRVLMAAGAGAGLATAFNAPLAGAIFVLEELVQRYEPRIAIAALGSSITAISVSRAILGDSPDFTVAQLTYPPLAVQVLFLGLGLVSGLLAVAYNITVLGTLGLADRLGRIPVEARGALIGAAVGVLAWFHPALVGGGDPLTQQMLLGGAAALPVAAAFAVRFVLGAVSYAAMTPGGLFAPMLTLGAQSGLMFGIACQTGLPGLEIQPEGFALVGMAAFFAGVVRSPVTGLILVGEMTHNVALLLPMVGACFTAMLVPALLRNMPIYESLRERAAQQMEAGRSR